VQNRVPQSQLPTEGILLRHNLTPGREFLYEGHTDTQEVSSEKEGADLGLFRNGCDATWMVRFIRRDSGGLAQVRNTIYRYNDRSNGGASKAQHLAGTFLTFGLNSQGDTVPHKEYTDVDFPYGEMNIELPSGKIKMGDVWRSRMRFLYDPGRSRSDLITATHTFKSVQWYGGFKCAIIESTFEAGPYRTVLESIDAPKPAGGAMGGASMGPSAGAGGAGGQTKLRREVTSVIKNGKRTTYFAYQPEVGRVLRMEETQEHHLSLAVEKPQEQNQMGGMMGGMPMGMPSYPGGMGMPSYPGGTMPGMMPGAMPGMMPGMQPGAMPGMMPGMQPGAMPGAMPGMMPGMQPGAMPGMMPGMQPGAMPGMMPGAMPGAMPGMMPGMMPGSGSGSGMMPGMMPGMMGGDGGMMGGGMQQEPPKYIITYLTRRVRTEIQQSYLNQR